MKQNDLTDLRRAVETLRNERYPDLDAGFLAAVIDAEDQNPEDEPAALRQIRLALNEILNRRGSR